MGLLNWGAAFSAAGGALSDFAGKAGTESMRAGFEKEKVELADKLAGTREAARDEREASRRTSEIRLADELRRAPAREAAARIGMMNAPVAVEDGFGGVVMTAPTETEQLANRVNAYLASGDPSLISAGTTLESLGENRGERARDRELRAQELKDNKAYREASLKIQTAAEGRAGATTKLDNEIKTIALGNAREVEKLRKDFTDPATSAERKSAIKDAIQLLTGKDNDNYLPVPIKDALGATTGYQIFDKKSGTWVEPKAAADKSGYDPATKEVWSSGRKIGYADNEKEARAKEAAYREGGRFVPEAAAAPRAIPLPRVSADRVPDPPSKTFNIPGRMGSTETPNPAYAEWERKYKTAWDMQQERDVERDAKAAEAKRQEIRDRFK